MSPEAQAQRKALLRHSGRPPPDFPSLGSWELSQGPVMATQTPVRLYQKAHSLLFRELLFPPLRYKRQIPVHIVAGPSAALNQTDPCLLLEAHNLPASESRAPPQSQHAQDSWEEGLGAPPHQTLLPAAESCSPPRGCEMRPPCSQVTAQAPSYTHLCLCSPARGSLLGARITWMAWVRDP